MPMLQQRFELSFLSPAFLGDASQESVWRVPPLKALLREWWRISVARSVGHNVRDMLLREQLLFGTANDGGGSQSRASRVRLALDRWSRGTVSSWQPRGIPRFEVSAGRGLPADLYLGYGPLQVGQKLKAAPAINAGEQNGFAVACPDEFAAGLALDTVSGLIHAFGTVGSRSRNGWGSLSMVPQGSAAQPLSVSVLRQWDVLCNLADCLKRDWPHAIGEDEGGPLVWESVESFADWRQALGLMAQVRLAMRREAKRHHAAGAHFPEALDLIVSPTTGRNFNAHGWNRNTRVANTLRFKLFLDDASGLRLRVYHTPCKPPHPFSGLPLLETWESIHRGLDDHPALARLVDR